MSGTVEAMGRREFLRLAGALGAVAVVSPAWGGLIASTVEKRAPASSWWENRVEEGAAMTEEELRAAVRALYDDYVSSDVQDHTWIVVSAEELEWWKAQGFRT